MDYTNALFHICSCQSDLDILSYPSEDFIKERDRTILTEHIKINQPSRAENQEQQDSEASKLTTVLIKKKLCLDWNDMLLWSKSKLSK